MNVVLSKGHIYIYIRSVCIAASFACTVVAACACACAGVPTFIVSCFPFQSVEWGRISILESRLGQNTTVRLVM